MENVKAAMENAGSAGKAEAINYQSVKQKFQSYLKHPGFLCGVYSDFAGSTDYGTGFRIYYCIHSCKRCSASDTGPVCMGCIIRKMYPCFRPLLTRCY